MDRLMCRQSRWVIAILRPLPAAARLQTLLLTLSAPWAWACLHVADRALGRVPPAVRKLGGRALEAQRRRAKPYLPRYLLQPDLVGILPRRHHSLSKPHPIPPRRPPSFPSPSVLPPSSLRTHHDHSISSLPNQQREKEGRPIDRPPTHPSTSCPPPPRSRHGPGLLPQPLLVLVRHRQARRGGTQRRARARPHRAASLLGRPRRLLLLPGPQRDPRRPQGREGRRPRMRHRERRVREGLREGMGEFLLLSSFFFPLCISMCSLVCPSFLASPAQGVGKTQPLVERVGQKLREHRMQCNAKPTKARPVAKKEDHKPSPHRSHTSRSGASQTTTRSSVSRSSRRRAHSRWT